MGRGLVQGPALNNCPGQDKLLTLRPPRLSCQLLFLIEILHLWQLHLLNVLLCPLKAQQKVGKSCFQLIESQMKNGGTSQVGTQEGTLREMEHQKKNGNPFTYIFCCTPTEKKLSPNEANACSMYVQSSGSHHWIQYPPCCVWTLWQSKTCFCVIGELIPRCSPPGT